MRVNYSIINARKKKLGITNADISRRTGITVSTLDKITSGRNQNPTLETLKAIASVIGCRLDDFDDNDNPPNVTVPSEYSYPIPPRNGWTSITEDEITLISKVRSLSKRDTDIVYVLVDSLINLEIDDIESDNKKWGSK